MKLLLSLFMVLFALLGSLITVQAKPEPQHGHGGYGHGGRGGGFGGRGRGFGGGFGGRGGGFGGRFG